MTARNPGVIKAIKHSQETATAQVIQAQFGGMPQEDPWLVAIRETNTKIVRYDTEFNTASVKAGKRPNFVDLLAHAFPHMQVNRLMSVIESQGALNGWAAAYPKEYLRNRGAVETLLKLFNDKRDPGEPEAQLQTLGGFLEAKRMQARLLGHEMRNPAFSPERYEEMYPIILRRVPDTARKNMARDFGAAPDAPPADHKPNDSYALYRMFDSPELRMVAQGREIAPNCQMQGSCYTAVGMDLAGALTMSEAYGFLVARGNMRDKDARRDLTRLLSDELYAKDSVKALERFGREPQEGPALREASPREKETPLEPMPMQTPMLRATASATRS